MINSFVKGEAVQLSDHFSSKEFDCHCTFPECTVTLVDEKLITALEQLRTLTGPLIIDSGFRCAKYNAQPSVGGVGGSFHKVGRAADVRAIAHMTGNEIMAMAEMVAVFESGGIGVGQDWAHLDTRGYPLRWQYD